MLTSDRVLFENAIYPVLLVNPVSTKLKNILVALDINQTDFKYQTLLGLVIECARSIAKSTDSKVYIVNSNIS